MQSKTQARLDNLMERKCLAALQRLQQGCGFVTKLTLSKFQKRWISRQAWLHTHRERHIPILVLTHLDSEIGMLIPQLRAGNMQPADYCNLPRPDVNVS